MTRTNLRNRTIFCRDNIDILQGINSNSIDLIYLDPPFNKNKVFTAPTGSSAEGASFKDIFKDKDLKSEWLLTIKEDNEKLFTFLESIKNIEDEKLKNKSTSNFCYLSYMAIRLIEMQRILKDTGSIYLHCDSTMSHYLKLLMDIIFEENNFRNEITWRRAGKHSDGRSFGNESDTIFLYHKTNLGFFNKDGSSILPDELEIQKKFKFKDKNGYYRIDRLDARGLSGGGYKYDFHHVKDTWRVPQHKMIDLEKSNFIHWTLDKKENKKRPYKKTYRDARTEKIRMQNIWYNIPFTEKKERMGYPTQKPLALLERIIKASSNESDIVLDPFCGCATTCIASEKLDRQWIGIDVSHKAYDLVRERLEKEVADPENILQYQNKIHYSTTPLKRTDINDDNLIKKYVYVISNPAFENMYKVGIATDYKARLNSYQTSDPDRSYKLEYKKHTPLFREIEKHIHEKFDNRHEWVKANLKNIINEIENYKL